MRSRWTATGCWGRHQRGIAATNLEAEGFEEVATVDRLLHELDQEVAGGGRRDASRVARHDRQGEGSVLDGRSVLVVDEAGMVGSRKLTRLLDHAYQAGAKVVLVGDDRQLGAIDAGGGFRGLRVRLGASVLTENRRQQAAWEREALELVRDGQVDQAVQTYREHDRMVPASSKTELTLNLVRDWWQAHQQAETAERSGEPGGEAVILAYRRDEVDRLNTTCQQVMARNGRLGRPPGRRRAAARRLPGRPLPRGRRPQKRLRPRPVPPIPQHQPTRRIGPRPESRFPQHPGTRVLLKRDGLSSFRWCPRVGRHPLRWQWLELSSSPDGFQAHTATLYCFALFEQIGGLLMAHAARAPPLLPHRHMLPSTATRLGPCRQDLHRHRQRHRPSARPDRYRARHRPGAPDHLRFPVP
jgi:hypothetical protein